MASSSPATAATPAKKTIVFSPADIKKIGLDKLIKVPALVVKADAPAEAKSDSEESTTDHVDDEAEKPVEEAVEAKEEPVSPNSKNLFCNNLKMKMAKVLQDKKITIVAKTKAQELVIIKRPTTTSSGEIGDGKKITIVQNKLVHSSTKSDDDALNGKTMKVVVKAKSVPKRKVPLPEEDEDDEESSPVFRATPMKTYKRKRDNDDGKPESPQLAKVDLDEKVQPEKPAKPALVLIPKKRGRKSKAELAEIARQAEERNKQEMGEVMEIKLLDGDQIENDDSDAEIIIVKVPKKDGDDADKFADNEEEEIHFITDKTGDDSEGDEESPKPKSSKVIDKKTTEELVQAIKKKRGRRSKAELEILARWERMERGVEESEEEEEGEEVVEEVENEEEEEISMIIMSPTRTGRVPKRNKIFDNYVTTSRGRKHSSDTEYTPKPTPPKTDGPKRGRGRPPKNRNPETPKAAPAAEEKKEDKVTVIQNENAEAVHVTGDDEVIVIPKKRGRTFVQSVDVKDDTDSKTSNSEESKDKEVKDDDDTSMEVDESIDDKEDDKDDDKEASEDKTEDKVDASDESNEPEAEKLSEDDEVSSNAANKESAESKTDETTDAPQEDSASKESGAETEVKTDCDEKKETGDAGKEEATVEELPADDGDDAKPEEGNDDDAEVVAVRRRGRQLTQTQVNIRTAVKRKLEIEDGPSTSGVGGVDEPSKRPKLDTSNEPVADLSAKRPHGEGPTARMYKLLVANLVVRIKEEMAAAQEQPKQPGATITCAICKINCKPTNWFQHKQRYHNNLAWKTTEKPLDLDDHFLVQNILFKLYPKKPCFCTCGLSKKSALGFLTHKLTCQQTDQQLKALEVPCDICGEQMLPNRLVEHDKIHSRLWKKQIQSHPKETNEKTEEPRKRDAAKRASMIITQVSKELQSESHYEEIKFKILRKFFAKTYANPVIIQKIKAVIEEKSEVECIFKCERKFDDVATLYEHLPVCDEKVYNYFLCKLCLGVFEIALMFRKHLCESHLEAVQKAEEADSFEPGDTKEEDFTEEMDYAEMELSHRQRPGTPSQRVHLNAYWKLAKFSFLTKFIPAAHCPKAVQPRMYAEMLQFCERHYSKVLFPTYPFKKSMWYTLNKNYIMQYLPRMKLSIPVGYAKGRTLNDSFKRYKLFESSIDNGSVNIFCGGPITAMAWAPTDHNSNECKQILAVAVQRDIDTVFSFKKNDSSCGSIQLWDFGVLDNKQLLTSVPELDVVIAHQHGSVFSMEWCPSGCYELRGTRLGLLAVCSMDGYVYCYSVGRSNLLREKILRPKPVFKLVASIECDNKLGLRSYYPTRLSWSKAQGHKYIAVGYSNGLVGMFHLQSNNDKIREVDSNNVQVFYPYFTFKADYREITALSLNHLDGGNRFLVSGSGTRELKFWDLRLQTMKPNAIAKRACNHQVYWPVNALSCMAANDDTSSNAHLSVPTLHLVDYDFVRPTTLVHSQSAQRCISGSDWGGVIHLATEGGEVSCAIFRDIYPYVQEVPNRKYMLSATRVVVDEDTSISIKDRHNFNVLQRTHKIVFHDANMANLQPLKNARDDQNTSLSDFSKFPLQAATALCTNSNRFSFLFTAVGYNIGFVRVFHSNFLNVCKPV